MTELNHLINFFSMYGYAAVFIVLLACGCGLPIPEDISLIAGGVICAIIKSENHKVLNIHIMFLVGLIGVLSGDCIMFFLGQRLGPRVTKVPVLKHIITEEIYAKIQRKVQKYGLKILFFARFLPGLRAPIFVATGVSHKIPFWRFLTLDGMAALISVPLWVYAGYYFADDLDQLLKIAKKSQSLVLIGVVAIVALFFIVNRMKKKFED